MIFVYIITNKHVFPILKKMDKELSCGMMALFMRASGKMIRCGARVCTLATMV